MVIACSESSSSSGAARFVDAALKRPSNELQQFGAQAQAAITQDVAAAVDKLISLFHRAPAAQQQSAILVLAALDYSRSDRLAAVLDRLLAYVDEERFKVRKSSCAKVPLRHGVVSVLLDPSTERVQFPFRVPFDEEYESA